jgi:hypothetical protein
MKRMYLCAGSGVCKNRQSNGPASSELNGERFLS